MDNDEINNELIVYYAVGNSLIPGNFDEIPEDTFYARIIQRIPYINKDRNFDYHEIAYTIFIGKILNNSKEILVFNFNYGIPYSLRFHLNKNDLHCETREEFITLLQEFKYKYDSLNEKVYTKIKDKRKTDI